MLQRLRGLWVLVALCLAHACAGEVSHSASLTTGGASGATTGGTSGNAGSSGGTTAGTGPTGGTSSGTSGGSAGTSGGIGGSGATGGSAASGGSMVTGGTSGSGGNGGSGGRPSCAGEANCPDGPLPTDPSIYGELADGAFYLFREPHITISGNPPVITRAINVANPGTRDLSFPNPPRFLANGGADGRGAAQFDGEDDYGEATGFSFPTGSQPSILVVLQFDDVSDRISVGVQLNDGTAQPMYFVHAAHFRTQSGDLYRANAYPRGAPHNIDYLMPEANNDLGPHLHETHLYASGMVAVYDGMVHGPAGGEGIAGPLTTLRVASNALGGGSGSEHAAAQISEIVITEGRTEAEAAAYRQERIRIEYPSLGL